MRSTGDPDVVVVGGGIAGLAAALRLADRGLCPLVLERCARIGGRMTTDRRDGFAIDTGVTLLGNRFRGLRAIARRLSLPAAPVVFSLAIQDSGRLRTYRAQRPLDLLLDRDLSLAARIAAARVFADLALAGASMDHGRSDRAGALDRDSVGEYMSGLGAGGRELLDRVLAPGLRAALGGDPGAASRFVLMQVLSNTLGAGFWNIAGGVDRLPEAIAATVPVELGAEVRRVRAARGGVEIEVISAGSSRSLRARAAILAVPGHLVPGLYADAPRWLTVPAARARFSRVASAHIALRRPPRSPHAGFAFGSDAPDGVGVLELEHLRAPGRCPPGMGMVSVYSVDTATFDCLAADDGTLRARAVDVVGRAFSGSAADVLFVHLIRWPTGIALFPRGRLGELIGLRAALARSVGPIDVAGDWLDGVASESAFQMGRQAADRIAARLNA